MSDSPNAKSGPALEWPGPPCLGAAESYSHVVCTDAGEDEPFEYYDELDAERWSIRCVRKYRDGRLEAFSYASENWREVMPDAPIPPVVTINEDPQFSAKEISRPEFEDMWDQANRSMGR